MGDRPEKNTIAARDGSARAKGIEPNHTITLVCESCFLEGALDDGDMVHGSAPHNRTHTEAFQ
jgi:hypothetical protein